MSGQLKRLKSEQAELLETFEGHLAVKSHLPQNKTVCAERAYQCFFKTHDDLKKNGQQQRQLLEPKDWESFAADIEQKLGEKNSFKWLFEQKPKIGEIEEYRSYVFNQRKDTLRLYTMTETGISFYRKN